jgi:hypothetical protein
VLDITIDTDKCVVGGDANGKCDASITTSGDEYDRASLQFRVTAVSMDPATRNQRREARNQRLKMMKK